MLFIFPQVEPRPNTLVPSHEKNEEYHKKFARYCLSAGNNYLQQRFLEKVSINKRFYKNDQWVFDEDLETFFKDDEGNERNRLKLTKNVIRPMIEQFRGNAIRMTINFRAQSISSKAISRREQKLAEMLFYSDLAEESEFGDIIRKKLPVGENEDETRRIFDELYSDDYEQKINWLLEYIEHYNRLEDLQPRIALDLGLNGLAVIEQFEFGGHQIFNQVRAENFYFDRSAINPDLSDCAYQGKIENMTPEEIFERWPHITEVQRQAISNFATQWASYLQGGVNTDNVSLIQGRVPVYFNYWKDVEKYEMAYVKEKKFGYPFFTKINFIHPGEETPRYTDADIIEVKGETAERLLRGNKKRFMYQEVLRTGIIIPVEVLSYNVDAEKGGEQLKKLRETIGDIVLDWGLAPYQETDCYDYNSTKFPFKAYCWGYLDGEIMSPLDDVIDPQRFINRIYSIAENQINNSRGSGTVYDSSLVDADGGEQEMLRNMNLSKPIKVDARGRGIQNVVSSYDNTIKTGTMVLFNILDVASKHIQDVTGVNEALKGESTGSDQLVGVTQLLIQRGSLMQEPFYFAMVNIFQQCYQSMASVGKRIYADNQRELAIATGDQGLKMFTITKDMKIEDFRCFVTRKNSDEMLIQAGDQMLLMYLQMQLINQDQFADLYGRSAPSEVSAALRKFAAEKKVMAIMQQKQEAQMQGQMQQMQQQEEMKQEQQVQGALAANEYEKQQQSNFKLKDQYAKSLGKLAEQGKIDPNQLKKEIGDLQTK